MSFLIYFYCFFHNCFIVAVLLQVRLRLGMAWPEETGQSVASTWYLKWQSEVEIRFKSRETDEIDWYFFLFIVRTAIYGYILFHVFCFMKRKAPKLLGFGPLRRNPNLRKLQRVVLLFSFFLFKLIYILSLLIQLLYT